MHTTSPIALLAITLAWTPLALQSSDTQTREPEIIQHDQARVDLQSALSIALDDERKAKWFYRAVIAKFGDRNPFANIVNAEARHESALLAQFDRLDLPVPEDRWESYEYQVPSTFQETCDLAVVAEIENVAVYDRIESMTSDEEVLAVFARLRWASQERHLRAFTRHSSGWKPIESSALTEPQSAQFDRAKAAQQAFFGALISELTDALQDGGPPHAIQVCSTRAPAIANQVSQDHHLTIARTSDKLRNPTNTPPLWSRMLTGPSPDHPNLMTNTAGTLAVLSPIKLSETCLQCHGSESDITPETQAALRRLYPDDRATGYSAKELRGWFTIEVPAAE